MEDDWDLQAVVRSCCGTASPTAPPSFSSYSSAETPLCAFIFSDVQQPVPDLFPESSHSGVELDDLWKPFCASHAHLQTSSLHHHHQHQRDNKHKSLSLSSNSSQHRSKRSKNQLKKVVCHVSAEDLCSDVWSWRKYGQKPIKGSPYPRGYYRCSSSKGCSARKQVERSKTDPTMFVLTYTSEHNHPASSHRNSLAGSTRLKCPENPPAAVTSNGGSSGGLSPATPLASPPEETSKTPTTADDEEENARGSMGNELEEDELFVDLEELRADVFASPEFFEECLSVEFPVLTDGYPQVAGDWVSL